ELKFGQRARVESHLHFIEGQFRAEGIRGAPKADILGDDPLIPAPAQTREFQVDALRAESPQQGILDEIGKADLIDIKERASQDEHDHPHGNAEPAEINAAQAPETALAGWRSAECGMRSAEWEAGHGQGRMTNDE